LSHVFSRWVSDAELDVAIRPGFSDFVASGEGIILVGPDGALSILTVIILCCIKK